MPSKKKKPNLSIAASRFSNFRQERVSFVTLAFGHAGKAKILEYDLDSLVSSGALHTAAKTAGTIFTMDRHLVKSQALYFCLFAVSWVSAHFLLIAPTGYAFSIQEAEELAVYLNLFIPFILGLYISLCLVRWWVLRIEGLGQVLDASQNIALMMSGMFPGPEWSELHDQILKWGLASVSLIVNACRGSAKLEGIGPKGDDLISDEETEVLEAVSPQCRPVLIWTWILLLTAKCCSERSLPPGKYRDIANECVQARNGISLIWTYIRTQLPFAYVHLVTFLVNLNNLLISVKCGVVMAMGAQNGMWSQCINQVLFLFIVPALYQGLLGISHVIHDPFGEDLLDFPVMAFQEYMNEVAFAVTGYGYQCPALKKTWAPTEEARKAVEAMGIGAIVYPGISDRNKAVDLNQVVAKPNVCSEETSRKLKETVLRMESSMKKQVDEKKELITALRQQVQGLESAASEMNNKLRNLENRLPTSVMGILENTGILDPPGSMSSGWCQPMMGKRLPLPSQ